MSTEQDYRNQFSGEAKVIEGELTNPNVSASDIEEYTAEVFKDIDKLKQEAWYVQGEAISIAESTYKSLVGKIEPLLEKHGGVEDALQSPDFFRDIQQADLDHVDKVSTYAMIAITNGARVHAARETIKAHSHETPNEHMSRLAVNALIGYANIPESPIGDEGEEKYLDRSIAGNLAIGILHNLASPDSSLPINEPNVEPNQALSPTTNASPNTITSILSQLARLAGNPGGRLIGILATNFVEFDILPPRHLERQKDDGTNQPRPPRRQHLDPARHQFIIDLEQRYGGTVYIPKNSDRDDPYYALVFGVMELNDGSIVVGGHNKPNSPRVSSLSPSQVKPGQIRRIMQIAVAESENTDNATYITAADKDYTCLEKLTDGKPKARSRGALVRNHDSNGVGWQQRIIESVDRLIGI